MVKIASGLTGANSGSAYSWGGGYCVVVFVLTTAGGSTAKLQISPDNGTTWIDIDNASATASIAKLLGYIPKCKIRGTTASGTAANIDIYVQRADV